MGPWETPGGDVDAAGATGPFSASVRTGEEQRLMKSLAAGGFPPGREETRPADDFLAPLAPASLPPTLQALFEATADRFPDRTALLCGETAFTYAQLDAEANRLARWLHAEGVGSNHYVGVYCDRTPIVYIALLAVLKAGAAYVPIDPACPVGRVRDVCDDADLRFLLTDSTLLGPAQEACSAPVVDLSSLLPKLAETSSARLDLPGDPLHACYAIFTSGSTGRPKGVVIEHRNAVHFALAAAKVYGTTAEDCIYQGFSLAFDASVEELWLAFGQGATLASASSDTARAPEQAAAFLRRCRATVFSTVPTFLAMIDDPLPTVRILIVGGEVCSPELVARFAPGRRMLNTYGPTETTVVATAAEAQVGAPVTIGRPLPGYTVRIVDEALRAVAHGACGELLIGGAGVARGYLGRPDLTAERFVELPDAPGRWYRSGDVARETATGDLEFHGRADGQIKLRGYRVELPEIEAALARRTGVLAAAVVVGEWCGCPALSAYVVVSEGCGFDRGELADALRDELPTYMIPATLDVLDALPTLSSGKVDRRSLPPPTTPLRGGDGPMVRPTSARERRLTPFWEEATGVAPLSVDAHFFHDLGGHSLLAAQLATRLRREPDTAQLGVRDLYRFPTVRALAAHLDSFADEAPEAAAAPHTSSVPAAADDAERAAVANVARNSASLSLPRPAPRIGVGFAAAQLAGVYGSYVASLAPLSAAAWLYGLVHSGHLPFFFGAVLAVLFPLASFAMLLLASVAAKWLLVGRYKAGEYPLWGSYYFRWWLATRLQTVAGVEMLVGTPLLAWYCRLMGARIGRGCVLGTSHVNCFDLLRIGDDTSIGSETQLLGWRVEDGLLKIGATTLGDRCFVGVHSALGLNVVMESDARLDDLSLLEDGKTLPAGTGWRGSPGGPATVEVPQPDATEEGRPTREPLLAFVAALAGVLLFLYATVLPSALLVRIAWEWGGWTSAVLSAPLAAAAWMVVSCLGIAAAKWLLVGRLKPETVRVDGLPYVRKWVVDRLLAYSRTVMLPLYATLYCPPWLRLMGAKIGPRCEVSTVSNLCPDLLDAGAESFIADGALIGGMRIHRGRAMQATNRIGRRTFLGNSSVLPAGAALGDESLVGVLSAPPAGETPPNGSLWLGSPSFALPRLQPTAVFDDAHRFRPTRLMVAERLCIDAVRILFPPTVFTLCAMALGALALSEDLAWQGRLFGLPAAAMALFALAAALTAALKWLVMGRFEPTVRPLWSRYVWWNECLNGAYEAVFTPAVAPFTGTPFLACFLRLLGCRIGRDVFLSTTLFSEFDLVRIEDGAALNLGATVQTHLFEDRVMKSSWLRVGAGCSVGNMAVVLYDGSLADGAVLGPLSLLMKGESLAGPGVWTGIPTDRQQR